MRPENHRPLPYFDALLTLLDCHPILEKTFGRHVHWGYWENPPPDQPNATDFANAAEHLTRLVGDAGGITNGLRVLDVGCGFGGTLASLDERFVDLDLHGLNIEFRQLARAKRKVLPSVSNQIHWVNANACKLPFADESFDSVLAVECIFHFPDRLAFFREAFRVLKPGGRLALSDFLAPSLLSPWAALIKRWPASTGFYGRCDVQFTFNKYQALAEATGFSVCVERDITRNTLPTYDFIHDLQKQIPFNSLSAMVQTLFLEYVSKLGLLRYGIIGFTKRSTPPALGRSGST